MNALVKNALSNVIELSNKYKVDKIYLFGSATKSYFNEKSDIDFLVSFTDIPLLDYADNYFDFKFELEDLFNRKIDLISERSLSNPYLIQSINKTKVLLYDRKNSKVFA